MMLCQRAKPEDLPSLAEDYGFDLKIDGIRCLGTIHDWAVSLRSRGGEEIVGKFPEIEEALQGKLGKSSTKGRYVLDGELVVLRDGLPHWPSTHKRQAAGLKLASRLPAIFIVFDFLEADEDLRIRPYWYRRELLDATLGTEGTVRTVLHSRDGDGLWGLVEQHRMEGIVAKRLTSQYKDGRSRDWLKIKRTQTLTCLVAGYDPGRGARASTFGALHLYLLDEDLNTVRVGTVGSGFTERDLRTITPVLQAGTPFIVEVEFLDVSPDGQLRQPVFQRVRGDVGMEDCSTAQLVYKEAMT